MPILHPCQNGFRFGGFVHLISGFVKPFKPTQETVSLTNLEAVSCLRWIAMDEITIKKHSWCIYCVTSVGLFCILCGYRPILHRLRILYVTVSRSRAGASLTELPLPTNTWWGPLPSLRLFPSFFSPPSPSHLPLPCRLTGPDIQLEVWGAL